MISRDDSTARDLFGALSASMLNLEDSAAIDHALHTVLESGSALTLQVRSGAPSVEGRGPDIKVRPLWAYRVRADAFGFDDRYPAGLVCVRLVTYAGPGFYAKSADVYLVFGAFSMPEKARTEFDMSLAVDAFMLAPGAIQLHPGGVVTLQDEAERVAVLLSQMQLARWDLLRRRDGAVIAEGCALGGAASALSRALDRLLLRAALDALEQERRPLRTADDLEDEED
jgi:hypothetical protein